MLMTSFDSFFPGEIVMIMTGLLVISAVNLYFSVLDLVTDKEFGMWAFSVGGAPLRIVVIVYVAYLVLEKQDWKNASC